MKNNSIADSSSIDSNNRNRGILTSNNPNLRNQIDPNDLNLFFNQEDLNSARLHQIPNPLNPNIQINGEDLNEVIGDLSSIHEVRSLRVDLLNFETSLNNIRDLLIRYTRINNNA